VKYLTAAFSGRGDGVDEIAEGVTEVLALADTARSPPPIERDISQGKPGVDVEPGGVAGSRILQKMAGLCMSPQIYCQVESVWCKWLDGSHRDPVQEPHVRLRRFCRKNANSIVPSISGTIAQIGFAQGPDMTWILARGNAALGRRIAGTAPTQSPRWSSFSTESCGSCRCRNAGWPAPDDFDRFEVDGEVVDLMRPRPGGDRVRHGRRSLATEQ